MAFVFQSYALYPHMTVRRNITFPLIMRQFKWWFHMPVIGGMAKRRIEAFAGGERPWSSARRRSLR